MVDVLIQTFNEELNLPHTLASVKGWANRIFVVDSGSTDATTRIAEENGAAVVHHAWEGYARQKNWALDNLPFESDWILILDADESVTEELRDEILDICSRDPETIEESGLYLNRVFIFYGREIKHCGYFPSWNLRLFKRGKARYEDRSVHEHMIVDGPTAYMSHLLRHEDRRGLEHFFAKHNRYSTLEAQEIYDRPEPWPGFIRFATDRITRRRFGKSRMLPYLPMPWVWRLIYMYFVRLGFMDGKAGWFLCNFISTYEFLVQLKYRELVRTNGKPVPFIRGLAAPEGDPDAEDFTRKSAAQPERTESMAGAKETSNGEVRLQPIESTSEPAKRDGPIEAVGTRTEATVDQGATPHHRALDDRALRAPGVVDQSRFISPWSLKDNVMRVLWMIVQLCLFRPSFHNWYGWRRFLLRTFGAKIGRHVRIRPTVKVEIPWNLEIGDHSIVGDYAILYSLGKITLGQRVIISQYAHICAGTHDYRYKSFPLIRPPIVIGDEAWIAADAFVGPNVTIGRRAVLGARASAFRDIAPDMVAAGNPAREIKPRERFDDPNSKSSPDLSHAAKA